MAKYLAIFSDMIDEVEINGFIIMSDKEVENFEELASSITWPFTYEFENGSEIEYSDGEDLLSRIEFKELNSEDDKTIKKIFNEQFGFFIGESFLEKIIGDEDSDDDDEDEDDYDDINYETDY